MKGMTETIGGKGFDAAQAHTIVSPFVEPNVASILVVLAGVNAGGVGFLKGYRTRERRFRQETIGESSAGRDSETA